MDLGVFWTDGGPARGPLPQGVAVGFAGCALIFFLLVLVEVLGGYRDLLRHVARRPRFGIMTMLEVAVVVAVAFSLLRAAGAIDLAAETPLPVLVVLGLIALVVAVGAVCLVHVAVADVWECLVRRRRSGRPASADPLPPQDRPGPEQGAADERARRG